MHHVVEPELEQAQQGFAGDPLLALGPLEVAAELALQHAVDALGLLLLPQLDSERREFAPVQAMLAGRIVTSLDGALVGEAARSLEEELHSLTTAQPALRLGVSRH